MPKRPPSPPTVPEVIRARHAALVIRQGYLSLLTRVAVLALALWFLFSQVFLLAQISGNGMFPAVKDGDVILAYRLQDYYAKNDPVVYTINGELRVGRILGREGDVITLDDSGTILVNGTVQSGEIMYPTYAKENYTYPYVVPAGSYFVLGDYRTQAEDSRDFGSISGENLDGKLITILRRRGI